jgi:hypothetical protein
MYGNMGVRLQWLEATMDVATAFHTLFRAASQGKWRSGSIEGKGGAWESEVTLHGYG